MARFLQSPLVMRFCKGTILAILFLGYLLTTPAGCREPPAWAADQVTETMAFASDSDDRSSTIAVPAETRLHLRLNDSISSGQNRKGDRFKAMLDRPIKVKGTVLAPQGTPVTGKLTKLKREESDGHIEVAMVLEKIKIGSQAFALKTEPLTFRVPPSVPATAALQPEGRRLTSERADEEKADADKDDVVIYEPGTRLTFRLSEPLRLPAPEPESR